VSGVVIGRNFTKSGAGVLKLSGTNSYIGTTTIAAGTLQLGSGNSIPNTSDVILSSALSVFDMNGNSETINSLASSFSTSLVSSSGSGSYSLTMGTGVIGPATTGVIFNGLLQDNIGSGTGSMSVVVNLNDPSYVATLGGANTYSGLTSIVRGGLQITHSSGLGKHTSNGGLGTLVSSSGFLYLQNGISVGDESLILNGPSNVGSLINNGGTNVWGGSITLASASAISNVAGILTLNPASGVAVSGSNVSLSISGGTSTTISGSVSLGNGGFNVTGGLTKLLTANSYSGATSVNAGILTIQDGMALSSSPVSVSSGASLQLQGGISVGNVLSLSGSAAGGTLRSISGDNVYTGNITLASSAVRINTDANTFSISGNISAGLIPLYFGSSASSGTQTTTVSGVISGTGGLLTWGNSPTRVPLATSLVKDGAYLNLILSATNSYTGATVLGSVVNPNGGSGGGVLVLGASEVIANTSHVVFNGGSLNTAGNTETIGQLSLLQDGGSLFVQGSVHQLSFSGIGTLDYKTLTINGWQGIAGSSGTAGSVYVGSSLVFTRLQLDQLKFAYASGIYSSKQLSSGELVPDVNTVTARSNIRITTGAVSNGSWSPALGTPNTTYTFTPNANNATINVNDIAQILKDYYSYAVINTSCASCTQVGQVDLTSSLTTYINIGWSYNRSLTLNAAGDVNISAGITLGYPTATTTDYAYLSFYVNTAGNITVSAPINTKAADYNNTYYPSGGGAVSLISTAGYVKVSSPITTSGSLAVSYPNYGGVAGAITINGATGVSVSAPLTAVGRTGNSGDISINDGNVLVSSSGTNDGVSGVVIGRNFTKSGAGVLKLSGTNSYIGTTTIAAGTLQLGSGNSIPDLSDVYFTGGNLDDGGFSETLGPLYLSSSASIFLGNASHDLTFTNAGIYASGTVLTLVVNDGVDFENALNSFGQLTNLSSNFVSQFGAKQNITLGGLSSFGAVNYSQLGTTELPIRVYFKSVLTALQKAQMRFYKRYNTKYYSVTQKPLSGTNGEIVTGAPR
jgi:autotransporter-associated beta strand protein